MRSVLDAADSSPSRRPSSSSLRGAGAGTRIRGMSARCSVSSASRSSLMAVVVSLTDCTAVATRSSSPPRSRALSVATRSVSELTTVVRAPQALATSSATSSRQRPSTTHSR